MVIEKPLEIKNQTPTTEPKVNKATKTFITNSDIV